MRELMSWETCKNEHIQNVQVDKEKIESIKRMCSIRQKIIPQIKLDDDTASVIATDYYEIIKELLVALMLKNKMKSDNHECLIAFFKHKFPKYEYEVNTIYQLKEVRNRVSYDGVFVKKEYVLMNQLEFENIIKILLELLEKI